MMPLSCSSPLLVTNTGNFWLQVVTVPADHDGDDGGGSNSGSGGGGN